VFVKQSFTNITSFMI